MTPTFVPRRQDQQQQQQQQSYSFSGRVLLTAVVILAIMTVVFVLVRLLLHHLFARGGGGGFLATGLRRSFGSFGGRSSSRRGLDASALAALPVTEYRRRAAEVVDFGSNSSSSTSTAAAAAAECAVCLSELDDGEKVRALPSCAHVFHVECVDAWLRSRTTCPVCRAEVRPDKGAGAARPPAPAPAPPAALFGAGGTLVVTVEGGVAETRGARTSVLGATVNRPAS
jgi:E3 ubiquitin-protein ligase ATL41